MANDDDRPMYGGPRVAPYWVPPKSPSYEQRQVMKALTHLEQCEREMGAPPPSLYKAQTCLAVLADYLECPRAEIRPLIGGHLAEILFDDGGSGG